MQIDQTWGGIFGGSAYPAFDTNRRVGFSPGSTVFHAGTAWWLAELSRVVYRHEPIDATLRRSGFDVLHHVCSDGAGCLAAERSSSPFAAARICTAGWQRWTWPRHGGTRAACTAALLR